MAANMALIRLLALCVLVSRAHFEPSEESYVDLADVLRDFCGGRDVLLSWTKGASAELLAYAARALQDGPCLTVDDPMSSSASKMLFLQHSLSSVMSALSPASPRNSGMGAVCQLSFPDLRAALETRVRSFLRFRCCNALVVNVGDTEVREARKKYLVKESGGQGGPWVRLWTTSEAFHSVCFPCGVLSPPSWHETLSGLQLRVGTLHNPPHSRVIPAVDGVRVDGFEMDLLRTLSEHFNFSFVAVPEPQGKFGGLDGDRWSGMIGQVHRRGLSTDHENDAVQEVDLALGGLSVFYDRSQYVDYVYPYLVDVFAFVTKVPRRLPLTRAILHPFQPEVWVALALSLTMGTLVLRLLRARTQLRVGSPPGFWLLLASLLLQSGWRSQDGTASFRALYGPWLLVSFVLGNAYRCILLAVLSVPQYEHQVDTLPQLHAALRAGNIRAGTTNGTAMAVLIMGSTDGTAFLIRRLLEKDGDLLVQCKAAGIRKAVVENYGYVDTRMGLLAAVAGLPAVRVSRGHFGIAPMSMALQPTCFYREPFSAMAARLRETGHLRKWMRDDRFRHPVGPEPAGDAKGFAVLDTVDLFSAVVVLLGGLALASCVFVVEVVLPQPAQTPPGRCTYRSRAQKRAVRPPPRLQSRLLGWTSFYFS